MSNVNGPLVEAISETAKPTAEFPDIVILTDVAPAVLDNTYAQLSASPVEGIAI
jgi:hypothetical protein